MRRDERSRPDTRPAGPTPTTVRIAPGRREGKEKARPWPTSTPNPPRDRSRAGRGLGHRPGRRHDQYPGPFAAGEPARRLRRSARSVPATPCSANGISGSCSSWPASCNRAGRRRRRSPARRTASAWFRRCARLSRKSSEARIRGTGSIRQGEAASGRGVSAARGLRPSSPPACSPRRSGWWPCRTSRRPRGWTTWPAPRPS